MRSPLLVTALLLLASACSSTHEAADSTHAASSADEASPAGAGGVKVHLVLTGGADAGTYDATPPGAQCIDYASAGANGLGIAYFADPTSARGITTLDFGVEKLAPARAGTSDFGFSVGIARMAGAPHDYSIKPAMQQGTGTVTVSGTGPRYTVHVAGRDADGVGVEATLECM